MTYLRLWLRIPARLIQASMPEGGRRGSSDFGEVPISVDVTDASSELEIGAWAWDADSNRDTSPSSFSSNREVLVGGILRLVLRLRPDIEGWQSLFRRWHLQIVNGMTKSYKIGSRLYLSHLATPLWPMTHLALARAQFVQARPYETMLDSISSIS